MALNQIKEEKKRKLKSAPWLNRSNPMSTYNEEGKPITLDQTPRIIKVIDSLKNTADYRKSINDPTKAFSAEASTNEPGTTLQNIQTPTRQTSPLSEPKVAKLYEAPTSLNLPKINEISNAQRNAELGKLNVSTEGNTTTYDIGGNTLSFEGDKGKINLRNINQSGKHQPTWNDYFEQQAARRDSPRGGFYGVTPITTEQPVDDSIGGMFVRGLQNRQARADAQIMNAEADRDMNRANFLSTLDRNQIARDQLSLDVDKNRIDEQGVIAENKLRNIQGQVLQNPPIKENPLKPLVIEEPDPNDPSGMTKRQVIKMPNAEGTGYVDDTSGRTTFAESQPDIIKRLNQMRESKDPKLAAAEAKYKAHFGSLPY